MPPLRKALLASVCLALTALSGCSWDAVGMGSADGRFNYTSTVHTPLTVTLQDSSNGDVLWTYEIPVGKTLAIRFLEGYDSAATGKDTMKWELFPARRTGSTLANSMPVPAASSRILKVYVRDHPEAYPQTVANASSPAPAPNAAPTDAAAPKASEPAAPTPAPNPTPAPAPAPANVVLPDPKQPAPSQTEDAPKAPPVDLPQ
ncbi:MAG: hypothetical protein ACOYN0_04035 [Phycisphaerales bacterium]